MKRSQKYLIHEYTDAEAFAGNEDHEDDVSYDNYDEIVSEESDDD